MDTTSAALQYLARGWQPVPVPSGSKNPGFTGWQLFTCTTDEVPRHFNGGGNIGLLLGTPSHGLVDIDCDVGEAVQLARVYLPHTGLRSGRPGNPESHFWYVVDPPDTRLKQFQYLLDEKKVTLIEFRATGEQTLAPPSVHDEDRDVYAWHDFRDPVQIKAADLLRIVQKIAIGALLARFWPTPGRHNAGLAVGGLFLSTGWEPEESADLVYHVAKVAGHERPDDRKRAVLDTFRNHENGRNVKGIPSLKECFPDAIIDLLVKWCRENSPNPDFWRQHERERQEEPRPLRRIIPDPEPFPLATLATLADPTLCLSQTIQAPLALCGSSILAAATLAVQPYRNIIVDGRVHPLSQNYLTIGESGERKSAVDQEALRSHRAYEKQLYEKYTEETLDFENDLAAYKKAREDALKKAKTRFEKKQALEDIGPPPDEPLLPILLTEEPTYEGIVKLFLRGQPSLGLFSDDGGRMIGGYGMSDDQQLKTVSGFSELWDGKRVSRVRAGEGASLLYGRRLATHLMAQPKVALRLLSNPTILDQGYLSRCLTVWPTSTAGTRAYKAVNLREHPTMQRYEARIAEILRTPLPLAEGKRNELDPPLLPLSAEAKALWIRFHDTIERQLADEAPLAMIRGFANKTPEHALRLAGVLTLYADLTAPEIPTACLSAGIDLAQHYLSEALRLFHSSMVAPDLELAETLLSWARQRSDAIALADIYQRGPNAIRDVATARKLVTILVAHGWFVPITGGKEIDGQFRREVWEVRR